VLLEQEVETKACTISSDIQEKDSSVADDENDADSQLLNVCDLQLSQHAVYAAAVRVVYCSLTINFSIDTVKFELLYDCCIHL
jgi:hypothetical protein